MKRSTRGAWLASLLLLALVGNADADGRPGPRPAVPHYHQGAHGADWLGALVLFGVAVAILDAVTSRPAAPAPSAPPLVVPPPEPAPPVAVQPAPGAVWYYCRSAEMYYPYARNCPEGWEELPAIPPE